MAQFTAIQRIICLQFSDKQPELWQYITCDQSPDVSVTPPMVSAPPLCHIWSEYLLMNMVKCMVFYILILTYDQLHVKNVCSIRIMAFICVFKEL